MRHPANLSPDLLNPRKERESHTKGGGPPSARMTAGCATGRLRATSLFFARSLSTWSPETGAPKPAYVAGARRLLGTTATCSKSSHPKLMREPWRDGNGACGQRHHEPAAARHRIAHSCKRSRIMNRDWTAAPSIGP